MEAVVVNNIAKKYRIPHEKVTTLFQNILSIIKQQYSYEEFWVLKDLSFTIKQGETFGIIGRNGSGKSTLLRILARVLYPDSGVMSINGKVAPFLELGVGFHPELTAKDNVFMYSSILGLTRKETNRVYDSIFDYAELRRFENMRLKNFSSGMYMRLAFSTAVHANPEILLIDEVLAVGDAAFSEKCINKINEFRGLGKTIVLVSHDLEAVGSICSRVLLLDMGSVIFCGETDQAIKQYLSLLDKRGINT